MWRRPGHLSCLRSGQPGDDRSFRPSALLSLPFFDAKFRQLTHAQRALYIAGLAAVGLSISGSVLLAVSYVERGWTVTLIGVLTLAAFVVVWFVVPLIGRREGRPDH